MNECFDDNFKKSLNEVRCSFNLFKSSCFCTCFVRVKVTRNHYSQNGRCSTFQKLFASVDDHFSKCCFCPRDSIIGSTTMYKYVFKLFCSLMQKSLKLHFCLRDKISFALPCRAHCSKSSFFVQKFNFDFPRKLSIFWGVKNS